MSKRSIQLVLLILAELQLLGDQWMNQDSIISEIHWTTPRFWSLWLLESKDFSHHLCKNTAMIYSQYLLILWILTISIRNHLSLWEIQLEVLQAKVISVDSLNDNLSEYLYKTIYRKNLNWNCTENEIIELLSNVLQDIMTDIINDISNLPIN